MQQIPILRYLKYTIFKQNTLNQGGEYLKKSGSGYLLHL